MLRLLAISSLLVACAGAAPQASKPAQTATSAQAEPGSSAERVRSRSLPLPLDLWLPGKSWRVTDGPRWVEAEQAQSASKLVVGTWRADRLVRRSECEAAARLARSSIPIVHEDSIVEQRSFAEPEGFDSRLVVGVEPVAHGVSGYALVFGASVGYCYSAVFTTTATGNGADRTVAARLRTAVDEILSRVRPRSVSERAGRHRLISN